VQSSTGAVGVVDGVRSAARRQRIARSVDSKPVAAAQHSPVAAGSTPAFSPGKASSSSSLTVSSMSRQKRPPPLHITSHTSALVRTASFNNLLVSAELQWSTTRRCGRLMNCGAKLGVSKQERL